MRHCCFAAHRRFAPHAVRSSRPRPRLSLLTPSHLSQQHGVGVVQARGAAKSAVSVLDPRSVLERGDEVVGRHAPAAFVEEHRYFSQELQADLVPHARVKSAPVLNPPQPVLEVKLLPAHDAYA